MRGLLSRVVTIHDMVVFEEKYNRPDFFLPQRHSRDDGCFKLVFFSGRHCEFRIHKIRKCFRYFPNLQERIHITYLGCDRTPAQTSVPSFLEFPEKYILYLGTLEKRKNVVNAIRAFEILKSQEGRSEKLVLAWLLGALASEDIQRAMQSSPAKADIVHLNYVPDEKITELYQRAQVFFISLLV